MSEIDEPILGDEDRSTDRTEGAPALRERIQRLTHGQLYGVLCTQADNQPYGSMVAFAFSDDLSRFVFSTPTATRKYRLLTECSNVALVVNNQADFPGEMMKIEAFTATGKAREIESGAEYSRWAGLLLARHPQLQQFIESPSTALFVVDVVRFLLVHSFQEVRQWEPPPRKSD
jgi:uncharacterized protein YhbP (UPF0306 family)